MCAQGWRGEGRGGVGRVGMTVWKTDESRKWEGGMMRWREGRGGNREGGGRGGGITDR